MRGGEFLGVQAARKLLRRQLKAASPARSCSPSPLGGGGGQDLTRPGTGTPRLPARVVIFTGALGLLSILVSNSYGPCWVLFCLWHLRAPPGFEVVVLAYTWSLIKRADMGQPWGGTMRSV